MTGKTVDAGAKAGQGWGGARPGAGRKRKARPEADAAKTAGTKGLDVSKLDMLQFLQAVARGQVAATQLQVRAAIAAVQYTHTRRSEGGKKDAANEAAQQLAGKGRFAPGPSPKLAAVDGKKV